MNKELISSRFGKTRDSYHKDASTQKDIANKLFNAFIDEFNTNNDSFSERKKILEIGSGSCFLTRKIISFFCNNKTDITLNDIAGCPESLSEFLKEKNVKYKFEKADAETHKFGNGFDYIFSSSVIQWFKDPEKFFEKCAGMIQNNGLLIISAFLPQNMIEIKEILNIGLNYPDEEYLKEIISRDFEIIEFKSEIRKVLFDSPIEVLRHMKKTGVNGVTNFTWTNKKLNDFSELYRKRFESGDKVSLTYNPVYIIARKK